MTASGWAQAVRAQLGLGRLLPLGGAADRAWIAETAAAEVLRRASAEVPGVRMTKLRVDLEDPERAWSGEPPADGPPAAGAQAGAGSGPAPASALPRGPLRIAAQCDAAAGRPLTAAADALRAVLWSCAREQVGLEVAAVDVHIAGLLEEEPGPGDGTSEAAQAAEPAPAAGPGKPGALGVPGVLEADVVRDDGHAEVRVTVAAGRRALDVARAARDAVAASTVAVLVTGIR